MANRQCIQPKGSLKMVRSALLAMAGGNGDGKSDLKACIPSQLFDVGKIQERAQKYIQAKPMKAAANGERLDVKDLKGTETSAIFFGLERYSIKGKRASVAAVKGKTFQSMVVPFKNANPCIQQTAVKRGIVAYLKKKKPRTFMYLTARNIIVKCDTSTGRRLGTTKNVEILIEVPEDKISSVRKDLKTEMTDQAALSTALSENYVVNDNGELLTPADVGSVSVADTSTRTATVPSASLPATVVNSVLEKQKFEGEEESAGKKSFLPDLTPGEIAGIAVGSIAFIGGILGLMHYQKGRAIPSTFNKFDEPRAESTVELGAQKRRQNSWAVPKQTEALPPHWQETFDQSTGKKYYWNKATNETSWVHPGASSAHVSQVAVGVVTKA